MGTSKKQLSTIIIILLLLFTQSFAWASNSFAQAASDSIGPFIAIGELSLLGNKHEAIQGAKALVATGLATELLKVTVREKRPNSESLSSFPSGHTSAAFATATLISEYKPKYKWPAFAVASVIGWSRVETGAHHWHDVAAGAALGYFMAKQFTNDRVEVSPQGVELKWKW